MKYNTLDIDKNDKEFIEKLIKKIKLCPHIKSLSFDFSLQKGIHVKMMCNQNCEICRIVFDDETRFFYDQFRTTESQNVLFTEKEFYKGNGAKKEIKTNGI